MKTIYYTASSLDGFIADSNNSLEWLFQFGEPDGDTFNQFLSGIGAIAMGSTTYQWIYDHQIANPQPQVWPYQMPAWVFTTRELPIVADADIRFVRGEVEPIHTTMKEVAGEKSIWIVGGGDLAGQFYDANLLDEITVTFASVTLGSGAPLFPRTVHPPLQLQSVERVGHEFVELRYQVPSSQGK
ncbi:dihydrofolate reductase family protein [Egbenema bharatensis]|uniref:dihydrofolate reductase family protein n=1 Tax=Egbenema bharatensis TaxID=3463334 RepID=UPI003A857AF7